MDKIRKLVVFNLDDRRFAINLSHVERVIPSLDMQSLPLAPDYISGTINLHGEFLPVMDTRKIFQLQKRKSYVNDHLIVTANTTIKVVLAVDSVHGVIERKEEEISNADNVMIDSRYLDGLFKLEDGIVLIHDLNKFLTPAQVELIKEAMKKSVIKPKKAEKVKRKNS